MSNLGDLFQEWRAADRAAHALEQDVVRASMRALDGLDSPRRRRHTNPWERLKKKARLRNPTAEHPTYKDGRVPVASNRGERCGFRRRPPR